MWATGPCQMQAGYQVYPCVPMPSRAGSGCVAPASLERGGRPDREFELGERENIYLKERVLTQKSPGCFYWKI